VGVFSDGSDPYSSASVIGTPVMRDREVMALIIAEHPDDEAFSRDHEEILAAAAGLLSLREELDRLRQRFCSIEGRDTLTGLPGVTLLDRHLHHLAMEVQTYGWYVGVIVADLDSFSNLNRLLGYAECDDLLRDLTCRFRDIFPREAFIARTGPDSFAACIPRAGKAVVEALCQRVADAFSFEYGYGEGGSVRISASIGAAYSHVNRRVLSLHTEAEALAGRAEGTGRASLLVRCLDSRAGSEEP